MKISRAIVHNLIKNEKEQATIEFSQYCLPIDEKAEKLLESLNESYVNLRPTYALFRDHIVSSFPGQFEKYFSEKTDDSLMNFSINSMEYLRKIIEKKGAARGGYLVFAEYEDEKLSKKFFSVFLIRDTTGLVFKKPNTSKSYEIDNITHLDLEKLAMACRIDLMSFENGIGKYLSVIKKRLPDISDYFMDWIYADQAENSEKYTEDFLQLINLADLPKNKNEEPISRDELKKQIYNFVTEAKEKNIDIFDISKHFFNQENYLYELAEKNDFHFDTVFKADPKLMKKLIKIRISYGEIQIDFPRCWVEQNLIRKLDSKNIIIESEELVSKFDEAIS